MLKEIKVEINNLESFKKKLLNFGNKFDQFIFLDTCNYNKTSSEYNYFEYDFIGAIGVAKELKASDASNFENLSEFNQAHKDWIFGYLSYDLKNETENLASLNEDQLAFPELYFFIPKLTIVSKNQSISAFYNQNYISEKEIKLFLEKIKSQTISKEKNKNHQLKLKQRYTKKEYIETVEQLKSHIQIGDVYEINFCQEFYSETGINPLDTYLKLREISPTPFSCYYKNLNHYLISASPERFLKKKDNKIISQPIKGTKKRGSTELEDSILKKELYTDPKERAENVMIVDLVRNDLSKTALKGSVKVEELFGVYSFKQVHQLISTVVSEISNDIDIIEVIEKAFPMGSMTGAPKVKAMELIEYYEKSLRGIYSGAVGFITPNKDFDFNVVIRSILYNEIKKYVSFTVGGAITSLAIPEKEYEECMIKAKAMIEVLK
ncbi:MAG: anthranilate synthase component I family protein [Bacteroidales bacterium]|nr:anthranilate synthase component I family protein [Bacteroidales bacterium]